MRKEECLRRQPIWPLLAGMVGCALMAAGDWLMIYGNMSYNGSVRWLTVGAAEISPWRNNLSMMLAFPAMLGYGAALFSMENFILKERNHRKVYRTLLQFSLLPWLCVHLYVVAALFVFGWMSQNGLASSALPVAEALVGQFSWLYSFSVVVMITPFLYWGYLVGSGKTIFPQGMAASNVLVFYLVLNSVKTWLPDGAFRIGFANGLMSESMLLMFGTMAIYLWKKQHSRT